MATQDMEGQLARLGAACESAASDETDAAPGPVSALLRRRFVLRCRHPSGSESLFAIAEVEHYGPQDPYTHGFVERGQERQERQGRLIGGSEQLGPAGHWYFHRAGKGGTGAFRGGTFKGLDLTTGRG